MNQDNIPCHNIECRRCKVIKIKDDFTPSVLIIRPSVSPICKKCLKLARQKVKDKKGRYDKIYRQKNHIRIKKYNRNYHKKYIRSEKTKQKNKERAIKNRNKTNERNRSRYQRDISLRQKLLNSHKKYRIKNKLRLQERARNRAKILIRTNIPFSLNARMSSHIKYALKGNKNGLHWENIVNYTLEELKIHLESKFQVGMTWDAFLKGDIAIDHILPRGLFTFSSFEDIEFKLCWSLNNLQPLWSKDNFSKNDKLPDGRLARYLSYEQKQQYLTELGVLL